MVTFSFAYGQKVYVTDYNSRADLKVYVTEYKSREDLLVYKVDFPSRAGWENKSMKHFMY